MSLHWLILMVIAWVAALGNCILIFMNWRTRQALKAALTRTEEAPIKLDEPDEPAPSWTFPLYCFMCGGLIDVGDEVVMSATPSVQCLSHGRPTTFIGTLKKEPLASTDSGTS